MKTARILLLLAILLLVAMMVKAQTQPKVKERFFMATYISVDSITNGLRWGSYFYSTTGGYFPNRHEIYRLIIKEYKLQCSEKEFVITPTEFKNKKEWLKFNMK
jgi:hypothetical protein